MICKRCGADKTEAEFYAAPRNTLRNGKTSWCKECCKQHQRDYRSRTVDRQREYGRSNTRRKRLRNYGLTVADYEHLFNEQVGVCAICGKAETRHPSLAVDHDHVTGRVRGLLCFMCNTAIGKFEDDPALLRAAADYLERAAYAHADPA